jgi:N6-adenosine-specific RNA methylase IME4/ParB-like chromosome segregation protein Spo0J
VPPIEGDQGERASELLEASTLPAIAMSRWRLAAGLCVVVRSHHELSNVRGTPDRVWMCRLVLRDQARHRWRWGVWCPIPGRFLELQQQRVESKAPTPRWYARLTMNDLPPLEPTRASEASSAKPRRKRSTRNTMTTTDTTPTPPPEPTPPPAELGEPATASDPPDEHVPEIGFMDPREVRSAVRIRKKLRGIEALAKSIEARGQIQPIVLDPEGFLVAGGRRTAACEMLGRKVLYIRCKTAAQTLEALDIEKEENTEREDLGYEDMQHYYELRLELEKAAAKDRQREGQIAGGKKRARSKASGTAGPEAVGPEGGKAAAELAEVKPASDEGQRATTRAATSSGFKSRKEQEAVAYVFAMRDKNPKRWGPLAEEMERTKKPAAVARKIKLELQAEAIAKEPPALPRGPFRVVAADFSWRFDKRAGDLTHRGKTPYPTMTLEEIERFPMDRILHKDGILFLWIPNALMIEHAFSQKAVEKVLGDVRDKKMSAWLAQEALHRILCPTPYRLLNVWGLRARALLTWVKTNADGTPKIGTGDWIRNCTEQVIVATREKGGKPALTLTNQASVILAPPGKRQGVDGGEHSAKPDKFYELVESLCPGSKVELFARSGRPGWTTWGDQAPKGEPGASASGRAAKAPRTAPKPAQARGKGKAAKTASKASKAQGEPQVNAAIYARAVRKLKDPTSIEEVGRLFSLTRKQASDLVSVMKTRGTWPAAAKAAPKAKAKGKAAKPKAPGKRAKPRGKK